MNSETVWRGCFAVLAVGIGAAAAVMVPRELVKGNPAAPAVVVGRVRMATPPVKSPALSTSTTMPLDVAIAPKVVKPKPVAVAPKQATPAAPKPSSVPPVDVESTSDLAMVPLQPPVQPAVPARHAEGLPLIGAGNEEAAPPAPPEEPNSNYGHVKPGGNTLVLAFLLKADGTIVDSKIVVPSGYPLKDITFVMTSRGTKLNNIQPPLAPDETRWVEFPIHYLNDDKEILP